MDWASFTNSNEHSHRNSLCIAHLTMTIPKPCKKKISHTWMHQISQWCVHSVLMELEIFAHGSVFMAAIFVFHSFRGLCWHCPFYIFSAFYFSTKKGAHHKIKLYTVLPHQPHLCLLLPYLAICIAARLCVRALRVCDVLMNINARPIIIIIIIITSSIWY